MAIGKKYGGRKAGTPNKVNTEVREAFKMLVEGEIDNLHDRLTRLSDRDYFNVILKMSEFFIPKLQSIALNTEESKNEVMIQLLQLRDKADGK